MGKAGWNPILYKPSGARFAFEYNIFFQLTLQIGNGRRSREISFHLSNT